MDKEDEQALADLAEEKRAQMNEEKESFEDPLGDSDDLGKIVFESRPEPFPTPEKLKIADPMELINANSTLLAKIVNTKSGPSPENLHGTWEVTPCHSSVGVIATRSFETSGMTPGTGAYYEVVQLYADPENKVFGPQTQTTVYVSLDEEHMLAAVNANTNLPQFSVLRKVSSEIEKEIEKVEEPADENFDADFPMAEEEIGSIEPEEISEEEMDKEKEAEMSDKPMKKSDSEPAKSAKKSKESMKTSGKDKADAAGKKPKANPKKIPSSEKPKLPKKQGKKSMI